MASYLIPSEKDVRDYLNDYETVGMSKETLSCHIYDIIDGFHSFYPVIDLKVFFAVHVYNIKYKTFIRNIIPFLVLNNICRVYYVDFGDGKPYYELFPDSESNQDKELFLVLNDNPPLPDQPPIDKETFESSHTRIDKNGNYNPIKI